MEYFDVSAVDEVLEHLSHLGFNMKEDVKKRILIIGSSGSLLINFRLSLIQKLIEKGYEVHAIATNDIGVHDRLKNANVYFHPLTLNRQGISPLQDMRYFFCLCMMIKKIKPNVCLAYTIKPVIYGIFASVFLGVRKRYSLITGLGYVFVSNDIKANVIKFFVRILYRLAFIFSEKVIFQNRDDQCYCCRSLLVNHVKTLVVGGSGVDLQHFSPTPFPRRLTFLMVSRFLPTKGILEFVEACKKIKNIDSSVRCCLVGYIDDRDAKITQALVESWRIYGVENYGKLEDVRIALADSSVFVLPSYYGEGLPRSILEAMAMGRPIITTDAPGCRETVIDGVNGFLVPVKDSDALCETMMRFVRKPELISKMGAESLHIAKERFDVNIINEQMCNIMQL